MVLLIWDFTSVYLLILKQGATMELDGKVALVLGAIKGIGKEIGLALAEQGVKVALNYFDWEEELEGLKKDFADSGCPHLILKTNLLEVEKIAGLIQQVVDHFGRLDILINNIERGGWPVVHGPYIPEQWDLEMETTLRAKRWVFDAALPHLKASGDACRHQFFLDCRNRRSQRTGGYGFQRRVCGGQSGGLFADRNLGPPGCPPGKGKRNHAGLCGHPSRRENQGLGIAERRPDKKALIDHTLLQRTGTVDDVVKAVLFILKDAPFMTGTVLRLDGGYVLGGEKVGAMPEGVL